jgi:hypothetical protein
MDGSFAAWGEARLRAFSSYRETPDGLLRDGRVILVEPPACEMPRPRARRPGCGVEKIEEERRTMAHNLLSENGRMKFACYKCSEGCVHMEYANIMVTLTVDQFLSFSECVTEVRRRLLIERDEMGIPAETTGVEGFVM